MGTGSNTAEAATEASNADVTENVSVDFDYVCFH